MFHSFNLYPFKIKESVLEETRDDIEREKSKRGKKLCGSIKNRERHRSRGRDVSPKIRRKKWAEWLEWPGQGVVLEGKGGWMERGGNGPHPTLWAAITHRIFAAIFRENPLERLAQGGRKMSEGLENRWVCIKHLPTGAREGGMDTHENGNSARPASFLEESRIHGSLEVPRYKVGAFLDRR